MDYEVMISTAKSAVITARAQAGTTITESDLRVFWTGDMMELSRVVLMERTNDRIHVVTLNDQTGATDVKTYMPEA